MKRFKTWLWFAAFLSATFIGLISCGGGGGANNQDDPQSSTIAGNVVDAPLINASVKMYVLNADGTKGTLLGSTSTDNNGRFTVKISPAPTTPFLAEATGGWYSDEVSGLIISLTGSDILTAVLPAGTVLATITPLTHMAAERARELAAGGTPLDTAVSSSNTGVATQYQLVNIITTLPGSAGNATQMQTATREERNYSLVLAGLATEASSLNVRTIDLAAALAADISDGILDGKDGSNPVMVPLIGGGETTLPATAGTTDLQAAINSFIASGNQTNLTMFSITSGPVQVGVNTAGLMYTTTTVLPAATSGLYFSTNLTATGGTPPYHCALKSGSLPPGINLSNCNLYGLTALLPGTTMSISSPFVVTVSDSGTPPATVDLELRLTTVAPPPMLTPLTATCIVNQSCSVQVASASGGTPPYSFKSDSFATGAPPLGTEIDADGKLTGTPSKEGTYTFGVCVVDLVGASDCGTASVTVNAPPDTTTMDGFYNAYATITKASGTFVDPDPYTVEIANGTFIASGGYFSGTVDQNGNFSGHTTPCFASCNGAPIQLTGSFTGPGTFTISGSNVGSGGDEATVTIVGTKRP